MSFLDITRMCLDSLRRRKGRTVLTVLGVFIGCVSIIIMVSIGAGMQESFDHMLGDMGDVTIIEIYGTNSSDVKMDDNGIKSIKEVEGVQAVLGKASLEGYQVRPTVMNDRYYCDWSTSVCLDFTAMDEMNFELIEGRFPQADDEIVVGQYFAYDFYDAYKPEGMNYVDRYNWDEEGNLIDPGDPFFEPMNQTVKIAFSTWDENPATVTKEFKVVGVLKEDNAKGYETSSGIVMSMDVRKQVLSQITGTPESSIQTTYDSIIVKATDIDVVTDTENSIKGLGYSTSSMQSIRESLKQEAMQIELMLGGLGAISLFVAAIGIANTMTMSITERTKEIGVMKALGCYVKDIRLMFLMEAGSIGLIGGICGLIFSVIVSVIINLVRFGAFGGGFTWQLLLAALIGSEDQVRLSVITPGLCIFAIVFSFLVGLISGYSPANKAVKISALEAIRSSAS